MIQKVTKYDKEWAAARKLAKEVSEYCYLALMSGSFGYEEDVKADEEESERIEQRWIRRYGVRKGKSLIRSINTEMGF